MLTKQLEELKALLEAKDGKVGPYAVESGGCGSGWGCGCGCVAVVWGLGGGGGGWTAAALTCCTLSHPCPVRRGRSSEPAPAGAHGVWGEAPRGALFCRHSAYIAQGACMLVNVPAHGGAAVAGPAVRPPLRARATRLCCFCVAVRCRALRADQGSGGQYPRSGSAGHGPAEGVQRPQGACVCVWLDGGGDEGGSGLGSSSGSRSGARST